MPLLFLLSIAWLCTGTVTLEGTLTITNKSGVPTPFWMDVFRRFQLDRLRPKYFAVLPNKSSEAQNIE